MADSAVVVDLTVVIDGDEASARILQLENGQAITLGRFGKNDLVLDHPGISNKHCELKLLAPGQGSSAAPAPALSIKDLSQNGTGLQVPGAADAYMLVRGEETQVPTGSLVVMPMTLKRKKNETLQERRSIALHYGIGGAMSS